MVKTSLRDKAKGLDLSSLTAWATNAHISQRALKELMEGAKWAKPNIKLNTK